jgi:RNA polymerase sigma factor (sigma-70 family)
MKQEAIDQVERLLAQAFGHDAEEAILRRAAERINTWALNFGWATDLRELYASNDHVLSTYIRDDLERMDWLRKAFDLFHSGSRSGLGHNSRLMAEERALVVKHWRLVDSEAQSIAREDTELYYRLTAKGWDELEQVVRRWDPTRNVTFGALARKRIRGCMLNYLERVWNREPRRSDWADDRGKRWFEGMTRAPRMERTPAQPRSRLIPGERSQRMIEEALAKLNPRQRVVYRDRVLAKPPLSRAAVASKLGIGDVTQISRIEKQARHKMSRLRP